MPGIYWSGVFCGLSTMQVTVDIIWRFQAECVIYASVSMNEN